MNPEEFTNSVSGYNPYKIRPWLTHDEGFTIAVVFASCEGDALDEAVNAGKLDHLMIDFTDKTDRDEYLTTEPRDEPHEYIDSEGVKYWWKKEPAFLGNASEPFDQDNLQDNLGIVELPNPPFSFVALFNAAREKAHG